MLRTLLAALVLCLASPALAQTQGNAVGDLVSKCGANNPIFGTGSAGTNATLSCAGVLPFSLGGTNASTASAAFANLAPTPTRAGDILYWNGSAWVSVAGNNSGTQYLSESSSGVPTWASPSGAGTVTSVAISGELGQTGTCSSTSVVSCIVNTASPDDNIAINAAAEVSQFNGTNAVTTSGYVLDQWEVTFSGTMTLSSQQSTDAPPGFVNSLKVSVTGAEASLAAGDYVTIFQPIEANRIQHLAFGTASASAVSVGEFVRANRTGTYSVYLQTCSGSRSYVTSFSIASSGVWQWVPLPNIAGDTSGTWATGTACGMRIGIAMAAGTTYQGSAGSWGASNLYGVTSTTNGIAATTDYMEITGLVVLPGTNLPSATRAPFVMRPFMDELWLCQRYLMPLAYISGMIAASTTQVQGALQFARPMRVTPSLIAVSPATITNEVSANFMQSSAGVSTNSISLFGARVFLPNFTGLTAGAGYNMVSVMASAFADARL